MPNLGVMFKTVSACNLACSYCYYPKEMTGRNENKVVPLETLDKFFSGYMQYIDGVAAISWQGGEPLAAGLKFFEEVVGLEKKYARKGTVIFNALQTNGTLIDDQWADFFRRYNFLIGVSLDGPQAIHDQDRMDITGKGSFKRVLRGIETLQGHRVPFNILCVVKKETVLHAREILRYFRECGFSYLQFIPCMNFTSDHSQSPAEYNITPEEYGRFLCDIFDEWYRGDGLPRYSIQLFDNFFLSYLNKEPDLCIIKEQCPPNVVIETDGNVYPCDFYIHPTEYLGNINKQDLAEIISNPVLNDFRWRKRQLPAACKNCRWLFLCRGGCPRNRNPLARSSPEYFCQAYQMFFAHTDKEFIRLRNQLRAKQDRQNQYIK